MGALVTAQWLAARLGDEGIVVVDATVASSPRPDGGRYWDCGAPLYRKAHIPRAVHADLVHDFSEPDARLQFTRPTPARFESGARALGVGARSTVVVYDSVDNTFAARLWWLFRANGHAAVVLLDGGLAAWRGAGLDVQEGEQPREAGDFRAVPREGLFVDKAAVERLIETSAGAMVSAFSPERATEIGFHGRRGFIPGTVSIPATDLLDDSGRLLRCDRLAETLTPATNGGGPVITYCGAGVAASLDAFALVQLGVPDVAVYDGSLGEWALDPASPVVPSAGNIPDMRR